MYKEINIDTNLIKLAEKVENSIKSLFDEIDKVKEYNSIKVLKAFQNNKISEVHFGSSTGYGYGDIGRDTIEKVFANVLNAEDCLVRNQFISGTHALTVALFAMLRPKDTVLSINGKPYDTLDSVIGIKDNPSSLKSYNINYEQIDLINNDFDYKSIEERIKKTSVKLVIIQRSRGYSTRKSLSLEKIEKAIKAIKKIDSNIIVMVDNCYGELVETKEPIELGADLIVGSLIKNLGGGIAQNGGYIAGRKDLVELAAERLTSPGMGKEVGPTLGANRFILQGLFLAPQTVSNSLKTAIFACKMLEELGYKTDPSSFEKRTDIVQTIQFNNEEKLIKFCQGIQKGSPIESNSIPEPWEMPGYTEKVIMAAGAFISGSSIELSCDAPIKSPYIAFLQGGITYEYGKIGVLTAIQNILNL